MSPSHGERGGRREGGENSSRKVTCWLPVLMLKRTRHFSDYGSSSFSPLKGINNIFYKGMHFFLVREL